MKKNSTLFLFVIIALLFSSFGAFAQKVFRTTGSGNWNAYTIWEISTTGTGGPFSAAPSGTTGGTNFPDKTADVIILNGHTVTLTTTHTVKNLTINTGATLKSDGTARSLRPYGDVANPVTITNNGTLGGTTSGPDAIVLEAYNDVASFGWTLTGTGITQINRIRIVGGSANPTHIMTAVIDQNITLTQSANYALTAIYNPVAGGSDNYTLTINAGKTVTINNASGYFNNNSQAATATGTNSYTYNINGTLDNSANVGISNVTILGPAGAGNTITVNINSLLKVGSFTTSTNSGNAGTLAININDGGAFDATANGATLVFDPTIIFKTLGSGKMNRTVGASDVLFPVATGTSTNNVTINNGGTSDNFSVNVKAAFDVTPPASKRVNRQWTINEAVAGGSNATLKFSWTTADQTAGFSTTAPVFVYHYNGTGWDALPATVSGSGTTVDPYVATVNGVTSFSPFTVGNSPVLPVSFMSTKAYSKGSGVQVEWTTATEEGILAYAIERSTDGRNFAQVGVVSAANRSSAYSWFDASPVAGDNFYRIKSIEGGSGKYTAIMKVSVGKGAASFVIAANPVRNGSLTVQLSGLEKGMYALRLYNNAGQQVATQALAIEGSSLSQTIALPSLSRGRYTVQLSNGKTAMTQQIIIE